MVPHQAVSQQSEAAQLSAFQKDLQELLFVLFVLKNLLLIDPSQHNVINFALCTLSGLSWHNNHPVLEYHNSSVLSTQRTVPCVPLREGLQESVVQMTAERQDLRNALKRAERAEDEPAKRDYTAQIKQISASLRKVRKEVMLCVEIEVSSAMVSDKPQQTREGPIRETHQCHTL